MPRFFLHSFHDGAVLLDEDGMDAADLDAARRTALKAATDLATDELCRGSARVTEQIVIAADTGQELGNVAVELSVIFDGPTFTR